MAIVSGAVEVRPRKESGDRKASRFARHEGGKPLRRKIYAGRLRLRISKSNSRPVLCKFVTRWVKVRFS